jgi:hypothetical protein
MPASVVPERATPCSEPFDEDGWRFSVDWDGSRTILSVDEAGTLRLTAESGLDVTARYPELRFAAEHIHRLPAVLDGVVATLDPQGRPDLEGLGLRIALDERGAAQRSVVFLATDVLFAGTEPTISRPLAERLAVLSELVGHRGIVQAPDTVEGRGVGLADAAGHRRHRGWRRPPLSAARRARRRPARVQRSRQGSAPRRGRAVDGSPYRHPGHPGSQPHGRAAAPVLYRR